MAKLTFSFIYSICSIPLWDRKFPNNKHCHVILLQKNLFYSKMPFVMTAKNGT